MNRKLSSKMNTIRAFFSPKSGYFCRFSKNSSQLLVIPIKEFNFGNPGGLQSAASLEMETLYRLLPGMPGKISEELF